KTAGDHLHELLALDAYRAAFGRVDGPKCNVVVVRAPVGHRAAGVFPPVAEAEMRPLRNILDLGRLTHPEIEIESPRNGFGGKRSLTQAGGQPDFDLLELADPLIADEVAGQAKVD